MSTQAAGDFLQKLVDDETLRDKVRVAEKGRSEKAPVLVQVAGSEGYDFTETELHDVLCALYQHELGALSREQLVAVAGSLLELPDLPPDQGGR